MDGGRIEHEGRDQARRRIDPDYALEFLFLSFFCVPGGFAGTGSFTARPWPQGNRKPARAEINATFLMRKPRFNPKFA
jgi:hypothetical protein